MRSTDGPGSKLLIAVGNAEKQAASNRLNRETVAVPAGMKTPMIVIVEAIVPKLHVSPS